MAAAAAAAAFLAKGVKVVTLHTLCLGEKDTSEGLQFPATPDWALNKQLTDKRGRHGAGRLSPIRALQESPPTGPTVHLFFRHVVKSTPFIKWP